jgi:hypothetical protein
MECKLTMEVLMELRTLVYGLNVYMAEALLCQWRTKMCKWKTKTYQCGMKTCMMGTNAWISRRMNEKMNKRKREKGKNVTTGITGITFVTLHLMDGFGPRLTLDTTQDRQRYVSRIHCMNLHNRRRVSSILLYNVKGLVYETIKVNVNTWTYNVKGGS